MKKFILFLSINLLTFSLFGNNQNDYKNHIKKFYSMLLLEKFVSVKEMDSIYYTAYEGSSTGTSLFESVVIEKIRQHTNELTYGLNYESICKIIDKSKIIDEKIQFAIVLELEFPNNIKLYFEMNDDSPISIQNIWLPTGKVFSYEIIEKESTTDYMYLRPGLINDKDGFVNIRKESNAKSKIVGKLSLNELFFYSPNSFENWWPVFRNDNSSVKPIGYIHKSRIIEYKNFPIKMKKLVIMKRSGC